MPFLGIKQHSSNTKPIFRSAQAKGPLYLANRTLVYLFMYWQRTVPLRASSLPMASCQDEQRDVKMQEETSRAFSSHARLVFSYVHKFHKFKPEPIALSLRPTNSWSHDILGIYMASTLGLPIFTDSRIHSI